MMKLYGFAESGNTWKLRILLGQLGADYELVPVDMHGGEHKSARFMAEINPRGQVPVLEDAGRRFWDSGAALVYLARKFGRDDWLPGDAGDMAEVMQWVLLGASEIQFGLQYARRGVMRGRWIAGNLAELQAIGRLGLGAIEWRLKDHEWLALGRITIADVACYPYVFYAHQAKLPLDGYPGIKAWLARCAAQPDWAPEPEAPPTDDADRPSP